MYAARRGLVGIIVAAIVLSAGSTATVLCPALFGYRTFIVQGASMGSSAPAGSLAVLRLAPAGGVEVGEIVLISPENDVTPRSPVLHRVVAIDHEGGQAIARTRGDANLDADPLLVGLTGEVLVLAASIPLLGFVAGSLRTLGGWSILVALPTVAAGTLAIPQIWNRRGCPRSHGSLSVEGGDAA